MTTLRKQARQFTQRLIAEFSLHRLCRRMFTFPLLLLLPTLLSVASSVSAALPSTSIRVDVTWDNPTTSMTLIAIDGSNPNPIPNAWIASCTTCGVGQHTGTMPNAIATNPPYDPATGSGVSPLSIQITPLSPSGWYVFELCGGQTVNNDDTNATVSVTLDGVTTQKTYHFANDSELCYIVLNTRTANSSTYALRFVVSTNPALTPAAFDKPISAGGSPINVQVPLGTIFSVQVVKKQADPQGGPPTVTSIASSYDTSGDNVAPNFETDHNLFTESPLVTLSPAPTTSVTSLSYAAVHLGTINFSLVPIATGAPGLVTANVQVIRPSALGTNHNEFDGRIIDAAHETGILPQILKGQIQQESGFNTVSFRYEPCTYDFTNISRNATLINTAPYSPYAMDDALNVAGFSPTIELRHSLYVPDGTADAYGHIGIRHINTGETGVTAKNIWIASDIRPSGPTRGHGERWSRKPCPERADFLESHSMPEFIDALDFTAQTPTSSSYGLMQVMWPLTQTYDWHVTDPTTGQPTQSPRYLVDTPEAVALHRGGSIAIGSSEDVERYWNDWAPSVEPSAFASQQEFFDSFIDPLRMYTGGGIADYGTNIINDFQFTYTPQGDVTFN